MTIFEDSVWSLIHIDNETVTVKKVSKNWNKTSLSNPQLDYFTDPRISLLTAQLKVMVDEIKISDLFQSKEKDIRVLI